jgi:hypothetical protein
VAFFVIKKMITGFPEVLEQIRSGAFSLENVGVSFEWILFSFVLIFFLEFVHYYQNRRSIQEVLATQPAYVRWGVYYGLVFSIIFLGYFNSRQFIYFQF